MTVIFSEPLHPVCLMHGLKNTFGRMPSLNKKVLKVRGGGSTDNVVAPPPLMCNPNRKSNTREIRNMVGFQTGRTDLL